MAAKYSRIFRSIWRDPDFLALSAGAQRLYLLLLTQPDISACGVLPLLVQRWAKLAPDTDADSVQAALDELATLPATLVVRDTETLEVWVRSYLKYDELHRVPNGRKAIDAALDAVASPLLRQQIERVYGTLTGTLPETLTGTLDERVGPPQQPAASSQQPSPPTTTSSRSQQPNPPDNRTDTFKAVIDTMVSLRLQATKDVRNPSRLTATLKRELPAEHGDTIHRLLEQFPSAPVSAIAAAALTGDTRQLAGWAS